MQQTTNDAAPARLPDAHYLHLALEQARLAAVQGEVPVGAVVVDAHGAVIGQGHNRCVHQHDPAGHAEIMALRAAAQTAQNYRLDGCTLYVTLEPCAMCAGAMLHARLRRVVYAVADPKTGAAGSVLDLFAHAALNHHTQASLFAPHDASAQAVQRACALALGQFFQQRRAAHHTQRLQASHAPLREDALRVPAQRFAGMVALQALAPYSRFALLHDDPSAATPPWRLHYHDTAPDQPERPTVVLLHGYACYSLLWADVVEPLHQAGWRVLAPDLPGHGQSDLPKKVQQHTLDWHAALLQQWLRQCQAKQAQQRVCITHDSGAWLAGHMVANDTAAPLFTHRLAITAEPASDAWRVQCQRSPAFDLDAHWACNAQEALQTAWSAPYPDAGHRAALRWQAWAHAGEHAPAAEACSTMPLSAPATGPALRQWLRQHTSDLLAALSSTHHP